MYSRVAAVVLVLLVATTHAAEARKYAIMRQISTVDAAAMSVERMNKNNALDLFRNFLALATISKEEIEAAGVSADEDTFVSFGEGAVRTDEICIPLVEKAIEENVTVLEALLSSTKTAFNNYSEEQQQMAMDKVESQFKSLNKRFLLKISQKLMDISTHESRVFKQLQDPEARFNFVNECLDTTVEQLRLMSLQHIFA